MFNLCGCGWLQRDIMGALQSKYKVRKLTKEYLQDKYPGISVYEMKEQGKNGTNQHRNISELSTILGGKNFDVTSCKSFGALVPQEIIDSLKQ